MPRATRPPRSRRRAVPRVALLAVVVTLVFAAALPGAGAKQKRSASSSASGKCATAPSGTSVTPDGPTATAVVAQEGSSTEPRVELVRYPRPSGQGGPWSQWGQGLVLSDGRFLSAMGNHLGKDGNAFLFSFDPASQTITRFADVRSAVGDDLDWGYGKIHGQIVAGPCNDAYFATYWGTSTGLKYTPNYQGDQVFRIDGRTLALTSLGVPAPSRGIPSLASSPAHDAVFGEAVDPTASDAATGNYHGTFFVLDPRTGKVVFRDDARDHVGFRNIMTTPNGHAYVAGSDSNLLEYVPGATSLREYPQHIQGGGSLRASTAPAKSGTVYFATQFPDVMYAFTASGEIEPVADLPGYTTSMAVEPDGSAVYSVPGAHGTEADLGTPLVATDPSTGKTRTLVKLAALVKSKLGLEAAGSYDVVLDPAKHRVYVGLNAGESVDDPWGEVVLAVVELP